MTKSSQIWSGLLRNYLVEHRVRLRLHGRDVEQGVGADHGLVPRAGQHLEFRPVGGIGQPTFDQRLVHLEVELEAVGLVAPAEGLLLAHFPGGELHGTGRDLEVPAVPLEHLRLFAQW